MKIWNIVFWVVMTYSVAIGYQHFGGPCCLHLQGEVFKMEAARSSRMLVMLLHHNPEELNSNLHCCENFKSSNRMKVGEIHLMNYVSGNAQGPP
jgi:hypothetical protein